MCQVSVSFGADLKASDLRFLGRYVLLFLDDGNFSRAGIGAVDRSYIQFQAPCPFKAEQHLITRHIQLFAVFTSDDVAIDVGDRTVSQCHFRIAYIA